MTLLLALLLTAGCNKSEAPEKAPDTPTVFMISREGVIMDTGAHAWIDFQTGELFSSSGTGKTIDCALTAKDGGYYFRSPLGNQARTRFHTIEGMSDKQFENIASRSAILSWPMGHSDLETTLRDSKQSPFNSDVFTGPCFIAFKTFTEQESNCYGIMRIRKVSGEGIELDYKLTAEGSGTEYSGAAKVEILSDRLWVDRKEFFVKGAACTKWHTMVADYGGNTVRIYGGTINHGALLDRLHEAGLKCYFGFSMPQFMDDEDLFTNPERRQTKIEDVKKIVEAFKNHPAILCWCLGNELETNGYQNREELWSFYAELDKAVHKADPGHPTTLAITNDVNTAKIAYIKKFCVDLDFLSINAYGKTLPNLENVLRNTCGWTKPWMLTEFGQPGTWQRTHLDGRINSWGALVQITSEQAADWYRDCYDVLTGYEHCLGSCIFWWGYQTHGEVLGWYPMFTRDGYPLAAVDAIASKWKNTPYSSSAPLIAAWDESVYLDETTLKDNMNPVLSPSTEHLAAVRVTSRSGRPLRYKWFIYKDNTYDISEGIRKVSILEDGEALQDGSMNEDARAELFQDRTQSSVRFSAPAESGNYRLYVIVYDDYSDRAATACLNFKVE